MKTTKSVYRISFNQTTMSKTDNPTLCPTCGNPAHLPKQYSHNFCSNSFHKPVKQPDFEDFKNQVAVKKQWDSFEHLMENNWDNIDFVVQVLTEATTLFVESEKNRIIQSAIDQLEELKVQREMPNDSEPDYNYGSVKAYNNAINILKLNLKRL